MPKTKPTFKSLPPTKFLRECFDYEPDTGVIRWKKRPRKHFADTHAWNTGNTRSAGTIAGTITTRGCQIRINGRTYKSHRIIFKWMTGKEPPATIDHKDGISCNNRWSNLRAATQLQQNWNRNLLKSNSSGYTGVHRHRLKWRASIRKDGVQYYYGPFDTPEEAAVVYEAAARELHGEFYHSR